MNEEEECKKRKEMEGGKETGGNDERRETKIIK
jgi:hypothetical protein